MANPTTLTLETYNHDVSGIVHRVKRFQFELFKSVSSGGAFVNEFDQARWAKYLDAVDVYLNHVIAQPQIDLPESHPRKIPIDLMPDEVITTVENESIRDVIYYLQLMMIECCDSQSSRMGAGLLPFDESRVRALNEKACRLLNDYVAAVQPLDLPESSPTRVMSGSGQGGI